MPLCFFRKDCNMTKEEIIKQYFADDEEILWFSKPTTLKPFLRTDMILIPLTLILGGYILWYAYASLMLLITGQNATFALSGITLFLIGLYLVFGRIWYRYKRISKNFYFVTNKRVFVFNALRNTVTVNMPLKEVNPEAFQHDLFLGDKHLGGDFIYGLGLDIFLRNIAQETPGFYAIDDPKAVIKTIKRANRNSRKTEDTDGESFI